MAEGLVKLGYRVVADVAHPHYPEWEVKRGYGQWTLREKIGGVHVRRRRHYVPNPPRGLRRLLSELSFGARLVALRYPASNSVIAISPSLFATWLVSIRLRLSLRAPALIVWVQDIYTLGMAETGQGGKAVAAFTRRIERAALKAADAVVVIHPRFEAYVTENLGIDPRKVKIIRNWTHLEPAPPIDREEARDRLSWPRDKRIAVHAGNMGSKQGLRNLVEAARIADRELSPIHFYLVGDGAERSQLEDAARGIECIHFLKPMSESSFRDALAAADVLLVNEKPGVASMAVPSKLTSYFDAGRPVVAATDPEGITAGELRDSGAGLVVPAGDPEALLAAVSSLCTDPAKGAEMGDSGKKYRREVLSQDAALSQWAQLIRMTAARTRLRKTVDPGERA